MSFVSPFFAPSSIFIWNADRMAEVLATTKNKNRRVTPYEWQSNDLEDDWIPKVFMENN